MTLRWLGLLAFLFYAVHGGYHVRRGHPEDLLWICHLGALGIAAGLLSGSPTANAIGVLWLAAGVPLWVVDLASGGDFHPTSLLTHLGGLALGVVGLRWLGLPAGVWWKALVGLIVVALACRVTTPAPANVNLAFTFWPAERSVSFVHVASLVAALALAGAVLYGLERGLMRAGVAEPARVG